MPTIHDSRHAHATLDAVGIGTLQLRDAGRLNIIGSAAITDLRAALQALSAEPELRVLVLRGSGERAFIGGADIGEMAALNPATAQSFISGLAGLCDAVMQVPVPVIARLAGWCLGGGLEVALACDLRLADDSAMFGMPELKVGIPSVIHAALLPRLIGSSRADWMLLGCENIDAARAEAWGLVHERCAVGGLDELVEQRARSLAALPPQALRQQKRLLRHWQTVPLAQAVRDSIGEFAHAYTTGEPQAAMGEFMARKRPAADA
ncbi:MAG TPA: enoyl-CoA hydratase [Rubrivivax sp.]|nr:enoyl-CoA hydratase [Rubrivivax sp.]